MGGVLGGSLGQAAAVAPRPQQPSFWSTGMTTQLTPSMTNNFVFSYTRTFWQWGSQNAPPQLPGLGGAIEPGGESTAALIPYNINTQSVRQRFLGLGRTSCSVTTSPSFTATTCSASAGPTSATSTITRARTTVTASTMPSSTS